MDIENNADSLKFSYEIYYNHIIVFLLLEVSMNKKSVSSNFFINFSGLKRTPNSSIDIVDSNGNIKTRRWFCPDGTQIRDVDFSNHGNAKLHPEWPHVHGPR